MSAIAQCLLKWDSRVLTSVTGCLRKRHFVRIMQWISRSADGHGYPAVLVLCAILQPNQWRVLAGCFCAFAVELAVYKIIKQSVKRPRPYQVLAGVVNLVAPPDAFSFPSGHTAGAFLVAVMIGYGHSTLLIPACFWASLVGFSRIYLCVHYPSDVFAGACLGVLSAEFGLFLSGRMALPAIG